MIDVYTANTPNGIKIPIALEELEVAYRIVRVNLSTNEQKKPDFLKISPNGRIPAIVDHDAAGGSPLSVFESGAILLYLADKYRALIPSDPVGRVRALEWLFFQAGGVGPMFGQAGWFKRSAEPMPVALERYQNESMRLTQVLESRLGGALAGGRAVLDRQHRELRLVAPRQQLHGRRFVAVRRRAAVGGCDREPPCGAARVARRAR